MSIFTDIKSVSDSAIEQLSGQFHNLPRPLLAAIGAGDMAVERLATLREQLAGAIGASGGTPNGDDGRSFATDLSALPGRAQQIAGEVAQNLQEFASSAPEKVQKLIGELPAKTSELTESLSPENIRGTVEAYTQMVAMIYGNLAERGEKAVAQARPGGTARSAGPASATAASGSAEAEPRTRQSSARPRTRTAAASSLSTRRGSTAKSGTAKSGTAKSGTAKSGTAKSGTAKRNTGKGGGTARG